VQGSGRKDNQRLGRRSSRCGQGAREEESGEKDTKEGKCNAGGWASSVSSDVPLGTD